MGKKIKELITIGEKTLSASGIENAEIDAEVLYCFETGLNRQELFLKWGDEADETSCKQYLEMIDRRAAGEPLQYITGEQWFMGHRFSVDPSVLIVRPETEILAEKAIEYLQKIEDSQNPDGSLNVLDLCTGSGALAIAIAKANLSVRVIASDISKVALKTAEQNAIDLGVADRIIFVNSDLFKDIKIEELGGKFDLIVTNPPYIRRDELKNLQREILEHEPLNALDGGEDGLDFYRIIASEAGAFLSDGGIVLAEIGHNQAEAVSTFFVDAGFKEAEVFKDYSGLDRVVKALY